MAIFKYTPKDIQRFWSKVAFTANPDKCWEWQASLNDSGYGQFRLGGKMGTMVKAHRISYELLVAEITDGLWVLHKCDNRRCCNPNHLFLGTVLDNNRDKVAKGRHTGYTKREPIFGRKLSADQVRYIRSRFAVGDITKTALAKEMGIDSKTLRDILSRKLWKNILSS